MIRAPLTSLRLILVVLPGAAPPAPRLIDRYVAPDSSVSELSRGQPVSYPARQDSAGRVVVRSRGFTLRFVIDDAGGCAGPHALVHQISGDSLAVTVYFSRAQGCPAIVTTREYFVTLKRLKMRAYRVLLFYAEDGQHPGSASGNPSRLDVRVSGL